jgi:hypothetical protein
MMSSEMVPLKPHPVATELTYHNVARNAFVLISNVIKQMRRRNMPFCQLLL